MFSTLPQPTVISAYARQASACREFPRKHRRWRIAELAARVFAQSGVPVLAAHSAVTRRLVCAVKSTCSPEELLLRHSRTTQGQGGKSELLYFLCLSFIICPPPPRPHTNPQRHDTHETSCPFCLAASRDPRGAEKLTGTHGRARWATPCAFLNSCANKLDGSSEEI